MPSSRNCGGRSPYTLLVGILLLGYLFDAAGATDLYNEDEECELWGYENELPHAENVAKNLNDFHGPSFYGGNSDGPRDFEFLGESTVAPPKHDYEFLGESTVSPTKHDYEFLGESTTAPPTKHRYEFLGESTIAPSKHDYEFLGDSTTGASSKHSYEFLGESTTTSPKHDYEFMGDYTSTPLHDFEFLAGHVGATALDEFHGPPFDEKSYFSAPQQDIQLFGAPASMNAPEDFHGPPFVASPAAALAPEDFYGPPFLVSPAAASAPEDYHGPPFMGSPAYAMAPEDFHGPSFSEPVVSVASSTTEDPFADFDVLEASTYAAKNLEEFHGPSFYEHPSYTNDNSLADLELLNVSTRAEELEGSRGPSYATENPFADFDLIEVSTPAKPSEDSDYAHLYETTTQAPFIVEDYSGEPTAVPQNVQIPNEDQSYGVPEPEQFSAPYDASTDEGSYETEPVVDDYGVPPFHQPTEAPMPVYTRPTQPPILVKRPITGKPAPYDSFVSADLHKTIVDRARIPPTNAKIDDQFVIGEKQKQRHVPSKEVSKTYVKDPPTSTERPNYRRPIVAKPRVHDSFGHSQLHETVVDRADIPPHVAKVHDEFVAEKAVNRKKKERSTPRPVTHSSAYLAESKAPVDDEFTSGVSHEVVVKPIRKPLEPKAPVHDEFTLERYKRAANTSLKTLGTRKLVCLKHRAGPKNKPIMVRPKILEATDFLVFGQVTHDQISRCIGHNEGDIVAAGLCKKHYLRCAPVITFRICTRLDEVFSDRHAGCVSRANLSECIVDNGPQKNASTPTTHTFDGHVNEFCQGRVDGFYRDASNCSRVLQCFDGDLFEYPPCAVSLAFDEKRGICDFASKVPGCGARQVIRAEETNSEVATTETHAGQCTGHNHGDFIADPTDCTLYARCVWDQAVQLRCPNGTAFNPAISVCDYANHVTCG